MSFSVEPIKPHIGAIVHTDRATLLEGAVANACLEALEAHDVLVFPALGLSDLEQLRFTDSLGVRLNFTHAVPGGDTGEKDVYKVTLDPKISAKPEYILATYFWHMDGMPVIDIPPPKATLLTARRLALRGGQTEFASTRAAYESLCDAEKAELVGVRAVHSASSGMRRVLAHEKNPIHVAVEPIEVDRPLVWKSKSDCRSLLIGETADRIVGMPLAEGRALLARLLERTAQAEFTYRHHWQEGDLVFWNNRTAVHRVIPYDRDSGRTMHRTSLGGDEAAK